MSTFNKYRLKGAYHYQWYDTEPWYKACVDEIVEFCKGSTLDVGGGDGLVATKIKENGYDQLVLDGDQTAVGLIPSGTWFSVVDLDGLEKDIDDAIETRFEYMACLNTIEHLNKPENLKYILKKYITKGAIIITNEYQGGSLGEDHKHEYSYDELLDFFKEFNPEGFKIDPEWIGVKIKL